MGARLRQELKLDISDTEVAFARLSNGELKRAYWLFKALAKSWLVKVGPGFVKAAFSFRLPVRPLIKKTLFKQFCGGETIRECQGLSEDLAQYGIASILDYACEAGGSEYDFARVVAETKETIDWVADQKLASFAVFKPSGIASVKILELASENRLEEQQSLEMDKIKSRFQELAAYACEKNVRLLIDAEESWIQTAVDEIVLDLMKEFNRNRPIIFQTIQMYRHDRLKFFQACLDEAKASGFFLGVKLVRGAYLEKERMRAKRNSYRSPIYDSKRETDEAYDQALKLAIENIETVSICAGTHNERSTLYLVDLMRESSIKESDSRVCFAQLLGMSDNLSFNLSRANYAVAKYMPYGPIKELLPYLSRRAAENTSIRGQTSRELLLILSELRRRGSSIH